MRGAAVPSALMRPLRSSTPSTRVEGGTALPRIVGVAVLILLAGALALVVRGWLHSDMVGKIPWEPAGVRRVALTSAVYWLVFAAVVASGRRGLAAKLAVAALVPVSAVAGVVPVAAVALMLGASASLGHAVLARSRMRAVVAGDLPAATAVGAGLLAAALAVMAVFPVNSQLTYAVLLGGPIVWQGRHVAALVRPALWAQRTELGTIDLLGLGLAGNLLLLHVAASLLPEVGADALTSHLPIASQLRDVGRWHYDVTTHLAAVFPMAGSLLFSAAYMFGGEAAARLANVALLLVSLGVVYTAVRSVGSRAAATLAVLVVASAPIALTVSASVFVENAWGLFLVAGLVLLDRAIREGDGDVLVGAAVALGGALAAKVIAIAALPVVAVVMLSGGGRRLPPRAWAWALLAGALVAAPPYLIALWKTGNPVFPFLNAWFQSPFFPSRSTSVPHFPPALDPLVLYRMTFYSDRFIEGAPGAFGFASLLLLPAVAVAALAWGGGLGRIMILATASLAAIVLAQVAYLRYLYPSVLFLAIALGTVLAGGSRVPMTAKGALALVALLGVALGVAFLPASAGMVRAFPLAPLVDARARADFVTAWAPARDLVAILDAWPRRTGAVVYAGEVPVSAGVKRPVLGDTGYTLRFRDRLYAVSTPEELAALAREYDVAYFIVGPSARPGLPALIDANARRVAVAGQASLYEVEPAVRFPRALLAAEGFSRGATGAAWVEHGKVGTSASGGILVDSSNFLYRGVPVEGGREYRLAVTARCTEGPAQVRLQVIWHDRERREEVDFATAQCSRAWTEESRVLRAPTEAVTAVVYAAGHDARAVELSDVTLRGQ